MSLVYVLDDAGKASRLKRVRCANEDEELQQLLERNHDLLPGDQIKPEDPRRWLLVKREMPVPDPETASDRWSIDLVFVDQDGMPTFVECKRFVDTRARREVVGQMLEYAANGHYYWDRETLREFAEETASKAGAELDAQLTALQSEVAETVDEFFGVVEENLREGQIRLVFFLDEAPPQLKSIVDFLNAQMERSEVLVVEARQYDLDGRRLIVPSLFGYTEQARRVKKKVTVTSGGKRRRWSEVDYFDLATAKLAGDEVAALRTLYEGCKRLGLSMRWGTGIHDGSFNVSLPEICPRSLVTAFTYGKLTLNFGWINGSPEADALSADFFERSRVMFGGVVTDDSKLIHATLPSSAWIGRVSELLGLLRGLTEQYARGGDSP